MDQRQLEEPLGMDRADAGNVFTQVVYAGDYYTDELDPYFPSHEHACYWSNAVSAAGREMLEDVAIDDFAQKAYLQRLALTQGYGLHPSHTRPFPGSQITNNFQQQKPNGLGTVGKLLGSLLLGSGLTAGGILGGKLLADKAGATAEDAAAEVQVFWGDKEIKPGESASSGTLKVEPTK